MASFSFPPLLLPSSSASPLPAGAVEAVEAVLPATLALAEGEALPLPQAVAPAPAQNAAHGLPDAAALRPDQVVLARQLTWPAQDGPTLARSWRAMVSAYGNQLIGREQQARDGQLPTALLLSGQDARVLRQPELTGAPPDAWRFTVQAGGAQVQHLRVVPGEPEPVLGRRRRGRAALRLELVLADGTVVMVQAEPFTDGVRLELCASDRQGLERLRELQPELQRAVERAGVRVLGWRYRDTLPEGRVHTRLPSAEAATMLTLPVFRAMAELALVLPR